jgi:SAM-dependent methyltransferase
MRERWRRFARADAKHYVAANRDDWDTEAFYAMGANLAAEVLEWTGPDAGRDRMLEIGCGAGRMLIHFATRYDRVDGVDIAPEMLEQARPHMPDNVHLSALAGADLEPFDDRSVDLVLSVQVFQHIPEAEVVASYLSETARVLKPDGRAVMQFDTRPNPLRRRVALALPDFALPRDHRRYIRRYPLPATWPEEVGRLAGLGTLDERGPGTEHHFVLFGRSSG